MWKQFFKDKYQIAVWFLILVYILYFSVFTILRYRNLYAHYYDLGIMHQTVYNTYMGLKTGDYSRILELTTPHKGGDQIKRMAVHNDIILALIAPLYFLYSGPEVLLVIQTLVLALGAWAVYKISKFILKHNGISLAFAFAYLMYTPMQRSNIFEFHGVVLATSFILYMVYFCLVKRFKLSYLFLILSLLTKEQVGLTIGLYGFLLLFQELKRQGYRIKNYQPLYFPLAVWMTAWVWVLLAAKIIIPSFRSDAHFAEGYFDNWIGNAPGYLWHSDTFRYLLFLLGPLAFFGFFAPEYLLVAAPEFGINLLSSNWNLRNIVFHYTAVLQPWIFLGSVYGVSRLKRYNIKLNYFGWLLFVTTIIFSYWKGPLPYSKEADLYPLNNQHPAEYKLVQDWSNRLDGDLIKVSSTGKIAPFFTSRRYFYNFSEDYTYADYVILQLDDVQHGYENDIMRPAYEQLIKDKQFEKIFSEIGFEVYKKRS